MTQSTEPTNGKRARRSELELAATELDDAAECLKAAAGRIRHALGEPPRRQDPPRVLPEDRLTTKQLAAIHAVARRLGLDKPSLTKLLVEVTGKSDPASLTRGEASSVLDRLNS